MPLNRVVFYCSALKMPDPKEILTLSHFLGRNSKKNTLYIGKKVEIWSGDTDPLLTARQTGREWWGYSSSWFKFPLCFKHPRLNFYLYQNTSDSISKPHLENCGHIIFRNSSIFNYSGIIVPILQPINLVEYDSLCFSARIVLYLSGNKLIP